MKLLVLLVSLLVLFANGRAAGALLVPAPQVVVAGTHGRFDFIKVDAARRRLLACHTYNGTLDVISLDTAQVIKSVPTGNAQGVAIDDRHGRYYVSCSQPPQLVIVDAKSLMPIGLVPLPEAADLVNYLPRNNRVFVDDAVRPQMWIIDPERRQIMQTNTFPGAGLEDFCFLQGGAFILQNIKETSQLVKSDWVEGKTPGVWSTLPASEPHGIAPVDGTNNVLVAGGTGWLVLMSGDDGRVLGSAPIARPVDEIAYDPTLQRVYCASSGGVISVVQVSGTALTTLGSVSGAPGAHSIAVDPTTNTVWTVYALGAVSSLQSFTPGMQ